MRVSIEEFEQNIQPAQEQQPTRLSLEEFEATGQATPQEQKGFISRALGGIKKAVVGESEFDLPEIATATGEEVGGQDVAAKIASGFIFEPSQEGRVSIIRQAVPNAKFKRDKFGNIIVDIGGKEFELNRSGLSAQDFLDIGSEIARFAGLAKVAGAATKGSSLAAKALAQGAAAVTTELATKPIAKALGSDEPVDIGNALVIGGFATAGELALPAITKLGKAAAKIFKGNKLSNKEKGELILAGINPDDLTEANIRRILKAEGANTAEKAAIIEAGSLPKAVPQTTGDITRNPRLQLLETEAQKGGFGEEARQAITGFRRTQQEALEDNIDLIKLKFGGRLAESPVEAGRIIQDKLSQIKSIKGKAVSEAYDAANKTRATIPNNAFDTIRKAVIRDLNKEGVDIEANNEIVRFIQQLNKDQAKVNSIKGAKPKFSNIERLRKRVNAEMVGALDPKIRSAGGIIKRSIDSTIDDFVEGGLLSGDQGAVEQIRMARRISHDFNKIFKGKDTVQSLVEVKGFGDASLKVDADDAINYIFGKNNLTKKGISSDINKLKSILPQEEIGTLKQAGFLRILGDQKAGSFSGVKFSNNLNKALKESPEAMKALYTKEELEVMRRFASVAKRVTTKELGGVNTSSTGAANQVLNSVDNVFGSAGRLATGLIRKGGSKASDIVAESQLRQSLQGTIPKKTSESIAPGLSGAVLGSQKINNKEKQ